MRYNDYNISINTSSYVRMYNIYLIQLKKLIEVRVYSSRQN